MSERRSNRSKKSIDYAKFSENGDDDDDDDFQVARSSSEKRQKTADGKSEKKRKKTSKDKDGSSQNSSDRSLSEVSATPSKKRLSVDEKVFERQLKIVLERSVCDAHIASKRVADNCDDDDEADFQPSAKMSKKKETENLQKRLCDDDVKDSTLVSESAENKGSSSHPLTLTDNGDSCDVKISACSTSCPEKEEQDDVNETVELPQEILSKVKETDDDLTEVNISVPASKSSRTKDTKPSKGVAKISAEVTPPKKSVRRNQSQVTITDSNTKRGQQDLSLISPVKKSSPSLLPSKGLRLGLSRKVSIKPLHPDAKLVL